MIKLLHLIESIAISMDKFDDCLDKENLNY